MFDPYYDSPYQRLCRLEELTEEHYGLLADDEVDLLRAQFTASTMRVCRVAKAGPRSCHLTDVADGRVFKPVRFPSAIAEYLAKGDILLTTLGAGESPSGDLVWHVLHAIVMST